MRKLRTDITLKEIIDFDDSLPGMANFTAMAGELLRNAFWGELTRHQEFSWPDYFYEQPPIGGFGKFWDIEDEVCWGYLDRIEPNSSLRFVDQNNTGWTFFTPCLPPGVDSDGYPKK